jgi:hypothetical protein
MATMIPNVTNINARFILQTMVEDRENKVRETLKLMSLSRNSYGLSYLIF